MQLNEGLILDADMTARRLKRGVLEHIGRTIAVLAIIICAVFTFTEIVFVDISAKNLTLEGAIILILATVMYLSLESEGEVYGRSQAAYESARAAADALAQQVRGDELHALQDYLLELHRDEVHAKEERMLLAYGLSREELTRYRAGERFGRKRSHQLRCVAKSTSRALTPNELLFFESSRLEEITAAPKRRGHLLGVMRILPSVLCTLLTVGVVLDLKDGFNLRLLLEGVMKLCALMSMGLRGYLAGVHYVSDTLTPYHKIREKLLTAFLAKRA